MNEISRDACNQENYHLHSTFSHLLEQSQDAEFITGCVLPEDIVNYIKEGFICSADHDMAKESEHEKQSSDGEILPTLSQTC